MHSTVWNDDIHRFTLIKTKHIDDKKSDINVRLFSCNIQNKQICENSWVATAKIQLTCCPI